MRVLEPWQVGDNWTALHPFKFLVGSHQPPVNDFRMTDCQP